MPEMVSFSMGKRIILKNEDFSFRTLLLLYIKQNKEKDRMSFVLL